ncbi:NACHT and WD domain protein [Xylogone sp. PMI_703]|nr:NACHT and WD domain protein [Xylogone sp. PMI_703]
MRRALMNFGRNRREELGQGPSLNSHERSDRPESSTIGRLLSEPNTETRESLYREEFLLRPKTPQHKSTSAIGLTSTRKSNKKEAAGPDPLGLTLVHDGKDPIADLIFVHGLGGTSMRTWSYDRDVKNFWLPWLAKEAGFSNTRIFTFGYNANFMKGATNLSILDFAKDLLLRAQMYQNEDEENNLPIGTHPIIFVAHSMGGLVVKKAYILGKSDDHFTNMISQTYGIVFLGTPHKGANLAVILNNILRVSLILSPQIYIEELKKGSLSLAEINKQFRQICGDLALVSFYETLKTGAAGTKLMVVEKDSAVLAYPGELSGPLHADHHQLTKYKDERDGNYCYVRNVLRSLIQKIKELESPEIKPVEPEDLSIPLEQVLGIKAISEEPITFREKLHPNSCRWILQKKAFQNWIEDIPGNSKTIYWLSGSPGIGKTTTASYIIDHIKQEGLGSCQYHFFQAKDHDTRTTSYFLRFLALQIAQEHEQFRKALCIAYQKNRMAFESHKYQIVWDRIFENILFRITLDKPLFWVLDGIDEAEYPSVLCDLMTRITSATTIKVLLVSRPTKDLLIALNLNSRLDHEEIQIQDTAGDIEAFVTDAVCKIVPESLNDLRDNLTKSILLRANGSFLWVNLALERVKDSWYTTDDIQTALGDISEGMDAMYTRMMQDVASQNGRNRDMAVEILGWVSCVFRPLDIEELAVALSNNFKFHNAQSLEAAMARICGNFIQVKGERVSLIHETARQFLLEENSMLPISIDSGQVHERIALACIGFLSNTSKWREKFSLVEDSLPSTTKQMRSHPPLDDPFLWYAVTHWAYHVTCAGTGSGKSDPLLPHVLDFFRKYSLLWIHAAALRGNLQILTRSATFLKAWLKRTTFHAAKAPITRSAHDPNLAKELWQWANDLVRVVGRFGPYLIEKPSSIHKYVVSFCPHDSMLYSTFQGSNQSVISVKGLSSGKWDDCLARLTMGGDERASKVIAGDHHFVTLIGSSGTIIIWSAETCEEIRRLYHEEYVTAIKASKSFNLIATGGVKTIRVWEVDSGQEIYRITKPSQGRLMSLAFTFNDAELLVAYDDCTVRCIDLSSSEEKWYFQTEDPSEPEHSCPRLMSFSQDAQRIAVAYPGRPVVIWRITQQLGPKPFRCIRRDDMDKRFGDVWNSAEVVLWRPNSPNILILYHDTVVVDWNLDNQLKTEHFDLKAREMAVSLDGSLLLTGDSNGTLSVWSTINFSLVYQVTYDEFVRDVVFSPDGQRLYDVRGTLCNVWEPEALIRSDGSDEEDTTLYSAPIISSDEYNRPQISAIVSSADDRYFCTGKEDGTVVIFEMDTAKQQRKLYAHSSSASVVEMAWSNSQRYIASVDDSGRLIAKRLEKPTDSQGRWKVFPLLDFRLGIAVTQLLFSRSEEFLLVSSGSWDRIYRTKTKEKLFQVSRRDEIPRRWEQHPTNSYLLVRIEGRSQALYLWSNLDRVSSYSPGLDDQEQNIQEIENLGAEEPLQSSLSRFRSDEILDPLTRVLVLQDRYLILEYSSSREYGPRKGRVVSRKLEMIDLDDGCGLQRISLPLLAQCVHQLVGVTQHEYLVFLDNQHWICTWDLRSGDSAKYTRHFFLPKDWFSCGTLSLVMLNQYGTLLCPKNGEVAVVREGIVI